MLPEAILEHGGLVLGQPELLPGAIYTAAAVLVVAAATQAGIIGARDLTPLRREQRHLQKSPL
jgi:hypothetical protein